MLSFAQHVRHSKLRKEEVGCQAIGPSTPTTTTTLVSRGGEQNQLHHTTHNVRRTEARRRHPLQGATCDMRTTGHGSVSRAEQKGERAEGCSCLLCVYRTTLLGRGHQHVAFHEGFDELWRIVGGRQAQFDTAGPWLGVAWREDDTAVVPGRRRQHDSGFPRHGDQATRCGFRVLNCKPQYMAG